MLGICGKPGKLLDPSEREQAPALHEVLQATGSSDEDIAAFAKLVHLLASRSAAVHDARTKHGAVAKTTSLVKDLSRKLPSWRNDEDKWLGANTVLTSPATSEVGTRCSQLLGLSHEL